jgi:pantoate--beta-alanine ligase
MTIGFCTDIANLREHVSAWRARGQLVALVPTMGALHDGHLSLVREGREIADRVVVTIFVNPTQFAPNEDFATYPRDLAADCAKVEKAGADLVYAPEISTMYPAGFATAIEVKGPASAGLEDKYRPTHFTGVATIVMKLLMQALPNAALFGEKDYQQLAMIRRMALDLDVPIGILGVPTVRESDGLAMSSRNLRLTPQERALAPVLHATLVRCAAALAKGAEVEETTAAARASLEAAGFNVDYVEARHAETLAPLGVEDDAPARVLAAARLGSVRLIDNVAVDP